LARSNSFSAADDYNPADLRADDVTEVAEADVADRAPVAAGGAATAAVAAAAAPGVPGNPFGRQTESSPRDVQARAVSIETTDKLLAADARKLRRKVALSMVVLAVVTYLGLGIYGADPGWGLHYQVFSPIDVAAAIGEHIYNFIAGFGLLPAHDTSTYSSVWPLYSAIGDRFGVLFITIVCAVLLAVSGMLYQNVFKNPIAGPGMLGVSSGVTLGNTLLVYFWGANALGLTTERYAMCYGFGAAILAFVILAGRKLSGKGKPFDIVTMLLIGSILSQLVGFISTYLTMFVMDPDMLALYQTLSQMLTVDTSVVSYLCLGVACVVSLVPVWVLRFRLNVLAFDEQEVRLLGVNMLGIRAVALICGAIMILAAQIHIGAVSMVALIVPFIARNWFGCESRKQLIGSICVSTVLLVACRCIVDLIPFVGDGIGIGSAVSVVALPLFLLIMAKHMRGWE
jgi:iron complex transport system permease protein